MASSLSDETMAELDAQLFEQMAEAQEFDGTIRQNLEVLAYAE